MKKKFLKYIVCPALFMLVISSCHKLNVPITTELTPDVYPQDSASYVTASGPVYVVLRGNYGVEFFFQQTLSTDEAIMPARGGNWYDGAQNQQMHYHTYNADNNYVTSNWNWLETIIGVANQALSIIGSTEPAGATKSTRLAEIKMMRDLAYFWMMDNYGGAPIDTVYGDFTARAKASRADLFNFIESDVKANIPYLSAATGVSTYGRANKYTAYALLAKMYLNADVYTGSARYDDCIAACDNVINSGLYSLASITNSLAMFYPTNGPTSPGSEQEFIFAIPYDPNFNNGSWPFRGVNIHSRYDVPRSMGHVAAGGGNNFFDLTWTPSAPESTIPSFYSYFYDPNDARNAQWLTGLQYQRDGVTPIDITTTYSSYDAIANAGNNNPYTYQLNLTPNVVLRQSVAAFDCGNDEVAWNMGYRCIKFYPDSTSANRNQNNDIPVFRYADIILMKAEAILRGGAATGGATALSLANSLRANRTTSPAWTNISLDSIYNERCREFTQENWHRNDMIRFGLYENSWGFKTDADAGHRIFPIPSTALTLNPALTQNTGY
jgi:hypothetical protein